MNKIQKRIQSVLSRKVKKAKTQKIELVQVDGYFLFVHTDDWFCNDCVPQNGRGKTHQQMKKYNLNVKNNDSCISAKNYMQEWSRSESVDRFVIAALIDEANGANVSVLDVGSLYGLESLKYASFCRRLDANTSHFSFDPGMAGALTEYNFKNNNYDELNFFPYAISDYDGFTLLNFEMGNNENNRIINPRTTEGSMNKVVKTVTLDSFTADHSSINSLFIKIDTQGAEHEVFDGMVNILANKNVAGIFEFFPNGLITRRPPRALLDKLMGKYVLFDVGANRDRLIKISDGDQDEVVDRAKSGDSAWTDIVFLPKHFECLDQLTSFCD